MSLKKSAFSFKTDSTYFPFLSVSLSGGIDHVWKHLSHSVKQRATIRPPQQSREHSACVCPKMSLSTVRQRLRYEL